MNSPARPPLTALDSEGMLNSQQLAKLSYSSSSSRSVDIGASSSSSGTKPSSDLSINSLISCIFSGLPSIMASPISAIRRPTSCCHIFVSTSCATSSPIGAYADMSSSISASSSRLARVAVGLLTRNNSLTSTTVKFLSYLS